MTATASNGSGAPTVEQLAGGAVDLSQYLPRDGEPVPAQIAPETDETFPVKTYDEARQHFRRPFDWNAVKFRTIVSQNVGEPRGGRALVVAYIDARLVIERLNMVVGGTWSETPKPTADGRAMWMQLDVMGVPHVDVGEDYSSMKALLSDALKRAAVKHGIGVSLYAVPRMWFDHGPFLRDYQTGGGKREYDLTFDGEQRARELYYGWLKAEGETAFGPVLSHGDALGSVGDALEGGSAPAPAPAPVTAAAGAAEPEPQGPSVYDECFAAARAFVGDTLPEDDPGFKPQVQRIEQVKLRLILAGADRDVSSTQEAIRGLPEDAASGLLSNLRQLAEQATNEGGAS